MKNYTITVNGIAYDVTVEEGTRRAAAPVAYAPAAPVQAAPVAAAPAPAAPAAPAPQAAGGTQGSKKINAPMPGKILAIKASMGQTIKKGDVVLVLEAMKMENEIVAGEGGTVTSINVSAGDMVESGTLLVTMN